MPEDYMMSYNNPHFPNVIAKTLLILKNSDYFRPLNRLSYAIYYPVSLATTTNQPFVY